MDKKNKVKSIVKFDDEKQPEPVIEEVQQIKKEKKKKKEQQKKKLAVEQRHVTIAIPDSIISNAQSSELRSYFMSQLARMFAIFQVDEVIILRDYSYIPKSKQFDVASYVVRNLQYLETPQYLRKYLFPIHSDLKNVGLMNPIESKHHLLTEQVCPFREGVVVERPSKGDTSWVEIGLKRQVLINYPLQPGTRVTLKLDDPTSTHLTGTPVSSQDAKREGYYWGYTVTIESKFHRLLERDDFDMKILIETEKSDETQQTTTFNPSQLSQQPLKLLLLFSGLQKITDFTENDEKSKLSNEDIYGKFDHVYRYGNNDFGVKQLRLEEDELNQSIGDIEFARSLEQTTIDFSTVDNNGRNLLHRAALQQNPKLIREILTEYSKLQQPMHAYINLNDKFGINAVQMCCFANYNERAACLELFLEDGDLNSFNPRTLWSPVHWVAFYGDVESMQLLISKEAILFKTDYEGYYPLDLAGRNNKKIVANLIIEFLIQFLIDYERSRVSQRVKNLVYDRFCEYERYISNPALRLSLFYWSCHFRFANLERFTALNRFYPLAIYMDSTALHNSIKNSNMEAFLYLLHSSQIKPFSQGMLLSRNATPQNNRIFSLKKEEMKIYKKRYQLYLVRLDEWEYDYLNNQISLLDQVDLFGNTPLHIAALSNNTEMINYLIQFGCRIDIQNSEYWTPVDFSYSEEIRTIFRENEKLKQKSVKNIQNFFFSCKLPTQKYDPVHKRNLYLFQAIKDIEVDNLYSMSQDLIIPDFVIKCSAQHITKLNFQIQVLINAKFEVYLSKSQIDDFYYLMLRSPLAQLQMQAMIQKVQVKLLDSYDYEPYDSNGHFEPFRSLQRQSIIEEHLNRILNIQELIQQKVIIDTYRMHSFGGTTKIRRQWLEQYKWYHTQPFKQLQDYFKEGQTQNFKSCSILRLYFGEQIAYFFAFKSYLTCFMIFAAFPGLILQLYILAANDYNSLFLPLYVIYMSIWSTITVEFWKRKQCEMNARWGLLDQMNQQELTTRLEFQGDEYMNHITHQIEKYEQKGHSTIMFMISIPVLILFSSFIVGLFVTIDYIQQTYTNSSYYKLLVGVLQGICVSVLNIIYTALVHYFVEKENHKFEEHYESSLIYKNVLFKFINSYIAVFYTAFIKLDSTYEEIFYILVPVLVIKQLSYLIAIMMIPQIIYKYKESSYFKLFKEKLNLRQYQDPIDILWKQTTNVPLKSQSRVVINLTTQQIQQNIDMDSVELNGLKLPAYKYLMTNYFMETMIDFGFITLFTAAFPMGPTIAMIMNIIEIRMKIYSFNSVFKRPQAQRVAGIGDWMYIWEFLSFIGVFTNYALVFLKQGDQINNYLFPDGSVTRTNMLWLFLLFIFLNVILKYVIQWIIPDKPSWVSEWEEDLKNKKRQNSELKQKEDECQQLNNRISRLEKQNNKLIQRLNNNEQNMNSITLPNESLLQQTLQNDSGSYLSLYYRMERDIALEKLNQISKLLKQKKQLLIVCAECQVNEAVILCQQCKIHYCKLCYVDLCQQHKMESISKGYYKMFYYSLPQVNQQGLKHLFDILCTYYENRSYGTRLFLSSEDFCIDDKYMINKLHGVLFKKNKIQWEEFNKYIQQLQKGTFEQRVLLMYDFMDEDKQGMISRDEFQNYAVYHMVQDTNFREVQIMSSEMEDKRELIRQTISSAQHSQQIREYLNALLQI
ncbi:unnamed protein product [Paramecium octaurelia]|uniref:EF-hand domain-containing protein n=1 Tax=Paramecium octaurelia TaxID=43137 RepID=A0A8S1ULP8_PAROT|nr:unnamed protein product [Paramecium octaurelia]